MTGTATLVLIRHAHVECRSNGHAILCGTYDAALSPEGFRQIEALRLRLASDTAVAAYASPLKRACGTARAAPPFLRDSIRTLASLREIHCGRLDGLAIDDIKALHPDLWARNLAQTDPTFAWPGGESYQRFRARVLRVIRCLAARHANQRILLFTHAGVINQIAGTIQGESAARWEVLRPDNASITEVEWWGSGGRLIRFGDRSHL